jgi:hypothetical protein
MKRTNGSPGVGVVVIERTRSEDRVAALDGAVHVERCGVFGCGTPIDALISFATRLSTLANLPNMIFGLSGDCFPVSSILALEFGWMLLQDPMPASAQVQSSGQSSSWSNFRCRAYI